ncbi:MAG TPA: hypothetical protein PKD53_26550 [Chloroflexaceae bacterium]|nr:hypothetical protein [Chloroflexaceae bacterium]
MLRVFLVDDHPAFWLLIEAELAALHDLTVVDCAPSGHKAADEQCHAVPAALAGRG